MVTISEYPGDLAMKLAESVRPTPIQTMLESGETAFERIQKLKDLPLHHQILVHQAATAKLSHDEALHNYTVSRLADLSYLPDKQKETGYYGLRNHLIQLGADPNDLPETYSKNVASKIQLAQQESPSGSAERKFQQSIVLEKLKAKTAADIWEAKHGVGQTPAGIQPTLTTGTGQPIAGQPPVETVGQPSTPETAAGVQPAIQPQAGTIAQPAQLPVAFQPSPVAEKKFQEAESKGYEKALANATDISSSSQDMLDDLNTFSQNEPKTFHGPIVGGIVAHFTSGGQLALKAERRMIGAMTKQFHWGRITDREMRIIQGMVPNLRMNPFAAQKFVYALKAASLRGIEYQHFMEATRRIGIRSASQAQSIWSRFTAENKLINVNGSVNVKNISGWQRYLSPQALTIMAQTPVYGGVTPPKEEKKEKK